ncbi:MAG: single-strand DNA-binding protein [Candidatus Azotimanducaceae bacterium]
MVLLTKIQFIMSGTLNKVMLIGNLGKDPEMKHFEGGGVLARFPIATSETYTSKQTNEKVTNTEWHNIVIRKGLAEVAEKYLHKGDKVFIEGKLKTRNWQDKEGNTRYTTEVVADTMTMLGAKGSGDNADEPTTISAPTEEAFSEADDDLPF